MWTAKEAYTKALGLGLGFNFRRVEFNPALNVLHVDNVTPKGWRFSKFTITEGVDRYQGVVAEFVGGEETVVLPESGPHPWLLISDASSFIERSIRQLDS
jgi:4'-phosphopantetheinyl transferase